MCGDQVGSGRILFSCSSLVRGRYVTLSGQCDNPAQCLSVGYLYVYKAGTEYKGPFKYHAIGRGGGASRDGPELILHKGHMIKGGREGDLPNDPS